MYIPYGHLQEHLSPRCRMTSLIQHYYTNPRYHTTRYICQGATDTYEKTRFPCRSDGDNIPGASNIVDILRPITEGLNRYITRLCVTRLCFHSIHFLCTYSIAPFDLKLRSGVTYQPLLPPSHHGTCLELVTARRLRSFLSSSTGVELGLHFIFVSFQ